ncbi:hypothetical protein GGQ68_000479 [Sagittula marina]|uniref:Uncharacterized protein n=1 Tax=Sagittula marina TaxID=943940 RepID=A0A7W6GR36_9RHOB|nr:hypothetical protein [Sagittula marina]
MQKLFTDQVTSNFLRKISCVSHQSAARRSYG